MNAMKSCPAVAAFACLLFAGCGAAPQDSPETAIPKLISTISENIPKGWKVGIAKDTGVTFVPEVKPDDIVVWKTEKVVLRRRPRMADDDGSAPEPVHVCFTLTPRPFIPPEDYPTVYATNKAIKAQYDYWNKTVAHMPRSVRGDPTPRGDEEALQVSKYKQAYKALPPYDENLPTHYYGVVAFKLWDSRPVMEPEERTAQTEMNTAYVVITREITLYRH